jgi:hypothetical protein
MRRGDGREERKESLVAEGKCRCELEAVESEVG